MKEEEARDLFPQEHRLAADWLGMPPPDFVCEYDDWDDDCFEKAIVPPGSASLTVAEDYAACSIARSRYDAKDEAMAYLTLEYGDGQVVLGATWSEGYEEHYWITRLPYYNVYVFCVATYGIATEEKAALAWFSQDEPLIEACVRILNRHWQAMAGSNTASRWSGLDGQEPGLIDVALAHRLADEVWR